MVQTPRLLERIEKLQNSTKNLGWGHCVLDPKLEMTEETLKAEQQFLIVCGHSHYRVVKTLVLEVYAKQEGESETYYGLFTDSVTKDKFDVLLAYGGEDFCMSKMIETLKSWFPEVRV